MTLLIDALGTYIDEVQDDCSICQRHQHTAAVTADERGLLLSRSVAQTRAIVDLVSQAAHALPDWRTSPFWNGNGKSWLALSKGMTERGTSATALTRPVVERGVSWGGRPIFIRAASLPGASVLVLELLLLRVAGGLPESPLRAAAHGLRCHEHLLAGSVGRCVPPRHWAAKDTLTLLEFLTRAMPENCFAVQCFSLLCAEK